MKKALVTLMAAIFLLGCYLPVYAADVDLYGSARMTTFWTDSSEEVTGGDSETQLDHTLQGNARIGAHFDAGAIGGRFEYGHGDGNTSLRLLYATFDAAGGEILVGQSYAPYGAGSFISNQIYGSDADMLQFIGYTGRKPMLQYSTGGFKIALVEPQTAGSYSDTELVKTETYDEDGNFDQTIYTQETNYTDGDPEIMLPQLQLGYDMTGMEGMSMHVAGVVQSYELQELDDEKLTAWGLTANTKFTALDPLYVNAGGFYGQNVAHFGQWADKADSEADVNDEGKIEDTNSYGLLLALGTQLDTVGLEAGVGYNASENDLWDEDDEVMAYYVQATVPIMDNAKITPEIGFYDYKDDAAGNDAGDELYAGFQARVDF
ncbi:MAG: hypothetical protein ACLFPI_12160 [Desulfobacterales bacterium]